MRRIKFLVYGVGPIGSLIAKYALERPWMEAVGAVDIDPGKVGRDLGDVVGLGRSVGVRVEKDGGRVLRESRPDVVLHATRSYLDQVYPQLEEALTVGANIISTCETLSYPYYRYPELARKLDEEAKEAGSTVLGAGVNPGFLLDLLPAVMTTPCLKVEKIIARRVAEASKRRLSFRKKIGLGMEPKEFEEKLRRGELTAHVGFAESVYLIADALGVKLERVEEGQKPLIAGKRLELGGVKVDGGKVRGVYGYGSGYLEGREVIRVEFTAAAGVEEEYEEIVVKGEPGVRWRNVGGTPGDAATAAVVLNLVPAVLEAGPGLTLVTRIRPPACQLLR